MEIKRSGSQPSGKGPAEWFTGAVRIDPLFPANAPARAAGNAVTFEPGARTAWHTHPLGQVLVVMAGLGRAQRDGGPVEEIRPGDVIWFSPGEKHWHGASPTVAMTHIAIQESLDGKAVDWMEKVNRRPVRSLTSLKRPLRAPGNRQRRAGLVLDLGASRPKRWSGGRLLPRVPCRLLFIKRRYLGAGREHP